MTFGHGRSEDAERHDVAGGTNVTMPTLVGEQHRIRVGRRR